jgi:HD-GYP domain-containing protein (c-di-GMP phosphodiesterase class II)
LIEATGVRLAVLSSDLPAARQHLANMSALYQAFPSQRLLISWHTEQGMYDVHTGNVDSGLLTLNKALNMARMHRAHLRDALSGMVSAYEHVGQPDNGLASLRELCELNIATNPLHLAKAYRQHLVSLGLASASIADLSAPPNFRDLKTAIAFMQRQAVAAELVEDPSGEHGYRLGRLAFLFALHIGIDHHTACLIELGARLHDIGKLAVPSRLLCKRTALTREEMLDVRRHSAAGEHLLRLADLDLNGIACQITRSHHENHDVMRNCSVG